MSRFLWCTVGTRIIYRAVFLIVVVVVQLYDIVSIRYREKGQHAKKKFPVQA